MSYERANQEYSAVPVDPAGQRARIARHYGRILRPEDVAEEQRHWEYEQYATAFPAYVSGAKTGHIAGQVHNPGMPQYDGPEGDLEPGTLAAYGYDTRAVPNRLGQANSQPIPPARMYVPGGRDDDNQ